MLGQRIKKLILWRLLFATVLLFAPQVFPDTPPLALYMAAASVCALSTVYVVWLLTRRWLYWLAILQIAGDITIESYLVFFGGGAESLFAIFYILSILSAALMVGEKRVILATTLIASVAYTIVSIFVYRLGLVAIPGQDGIYLSYSIGVKIAIFTAAGYLSRYLSERVLMLEGQLRLAERLSYLGEVVSKIAHEIRNPLSSIRTAAEVLRDSLQGKLSDQESRMVAIVDSESDRLTKTLERILGYARQVRPNPKMLALEPLIARALELVKLQFRLQTEAITVEKRYDTRTTRVYADEEQIVGVFLNLFLNAYQAMPRGGRLIIRASEELRGTQIDLEDTAGGISREKLKDLFVPFKSTKKGGTGLGLAEVHKIVTLHEGKIDVESIEGQGTVFHLYFPKP